MGTDVNILDGSSSP